MRVYIILDLVEAYLVDGHKLGDAVQLARPGRPVQRRVARGVRLVHRHPVTGAENICIMVKNNITSEPETLPHELQVAALGGVVQRARAALATRRLHLDNSGYITPVKSFHRSPCCWG